MKTYQDLEPGYPKAEDKKYFTPSIEDIRVGYEGEYYNWSIDELDVPELNYDGWENTILTKGNIETMLKYGIKGFRVPYLTKEQIEYEGWKISKYSMLFTDFNEKDNSKDYYGYSFEKENYILYYNTGSKILSVIVKDLSLVENSDFGKMPVFRGECKCINDFRLIMKLLCTK